MKEFLNRIGKLQELYREINLLKIDELVNEKKKKEYEAIIEEMKPVALSLKEKDGLDEFDFSSNEGFYKSVKVFLNKTA